MLPQDDGEAAPFLANVAEDERFATWHLVLRDGALVGYGTGGRELLEAMSVTRPAAQLFARVPDRLLEHGYCFVARHRRRLGRLVPDRPGPRRFP